MIQTRSYLSMQLARARSHWTISRLKWMKQRPPMYGNIIVISRITRAGLEQAGADTLCRLISAKIKASYIYGMEYLAAHNVTKFKSGSGVASP